MSYTPFKMKGNPMQRNFGIGASPAKKGHKDNQETKPAKTYSYLEDPKRERTDAQGRTQKEVMEMRTKNERDYVDKVRKYEKKKGGLTEAEAKKARKRASELSKKTVFSADSIQGVNKQLMRKMEAEAYLKGNLNLRDFEDKRKSKSIYNNISIKVGKK